MGKEKTLKGLLRKTNEMLKDTAKGLALVERIDSLRTAISRETDEIEKAKKEKELESLKIELEKFEKEKKL